MKPFVRVPKEIVTDTTIGAKAFRILIHCLGKPPIYNHHQDVIARQLSLGIVATRKAFLELIKAGYCERRRIRAPSGKLVAQAYRFHAEPHDKNCRLDKSPIKQGTNSQKPSNFKDRPHDRNHPMETVAVINTDQRSKDSTAQPVENALEKVLAKLRANVCR